MKLDGTKESCTCSECQSYCQHKPGWFLPGEAEQLALHLGISLQDLFDSKLAVDWWVSNPDIFLLSPAIISGEIGMEFPANPRGDCIFFEDDLCKIHPVRPFECRETFHNENNDRLHKQIADSWIPCQDQIIKLLGRQPKSKSFTIFDFLQSTHL